MPTSRSSSGLRASRCDRLGKAEATLLTGKDLFPTTLRLFTRHQAAWKHKVTATNAVIAIPVSFILNLPFDSQVYTKLRNIFGISLAKDGDADKRNPTPSISSTSTFFEIWCLNDIETNDGKLPFVEIR